eukprot:700552-Pleurochrysis_carterae.AAC.1
MMRALGLVQVERASSASRYFIEAHALAFSRGAYDESTCVCRFLAALSDEGTCVGLTVQTVW